jgi:protein gp37
LADGSSIEWTQATWNPTTGCDKVSDGCDNCYALTLAKRLKAMGADKYQHDGDPRTSGPGFGITIHPDALRLPYTWRTPRLVFVNSMSDLFHARVPVPFIRQVLQVMQDTPQHTYQVLTKRSRRLLRLDLEWPPNLWIGVSVENAQVLGRVDDLRQVPAAVRFLSCEPLLGPLDGIDLTGIHWVIAGGNPDHGRGRWSHSGLLTCATCVPRQRCRSSSSSGAGAPPKPAADSWTVRLMTGCPSALRSLPEAGRR